MRRTNSKRLIAAMTMLLLLAAAATAMSAPNGKRAAHAGKKPAKPLVIGHRGAAGYRPEHTLAS